MCYSWQHRARRTGALALALVLGGLLLAGFGARARAQATGASVTYQTGWNLVALPPGSVIPGPLGPLYTYQAGDTAYESVQNTQLGLGYWAYFTSPTAATLAAGSSTPFTITAPAGQYIMLGNPSGTQAATISGADVVYGFDTAANGYTTVTSLNPGQGAWVFSYNGGTITITPNGPAVVTPTTSGAPPSGAQPPAARFYGSVTVHGQAAAAGTPITATAATGATCGSSTVGAAPATGSNYALDIISGDPGCTAAGAAISFSVGGAPATASPAATIPDVSGAVKADLVVP